VKLHAYHPDGLKKLKPGLKFTSYREVYTKDSKVLLERK
jgi:hypothetical protein